MPGNNKQLLYLGGGLAGLFFVPAGYSAWSASREEGRIFQEVAAEAAAERRAEAAAKKEEAAVTGFEAAVQQKQADVEAIEAEIAVVQRRLDELQEIKEARLKEAADAAGALEASQGKLAQLVAEARRHREAATAGQAALAEARQHTADAKAGLLNPLQHPLVRSFRRGQ